MARTADTQAFSERLRRALTRSHRKIETPSQLLQQFNLRYTGTGAGAPVSKQAVQKWLAGESCPTPEKIALLATMCNVSEQWLRFGVGNPEPKPAGAEPQTVTRSSLTADEIALVGKLRHLTAHQKELILRLVDQLTFGHER